MFRRLTLGRSLKMASGAAMLALAAAACGSSGSSSTGASADASGGTQPTGSTWVLGSLDTLTGRASSSLAAAKPAMQAWESWTNAHGGINGHKIKVVFGDDQGETSVGLSQVQKMVQDDHIIAMVGSTTNAIPGIASYLAANNIPVIGGTSPVYVAGVKPYPKYVYAVGPNLAASSVTSFQAAKSAGGSKVGIVYCAESPTCQTIAGTFKGFASQAGLTTSYQGAVSATAPSYTAPCLALKNSGADTAVLALDNHTLGSVVQQCAQQGYKPIIVGQTVEVTPSWATDPNFAKSVGSLYDFPWWENSVPAIADYTAAMKQYNNSGDLSAAANPAVATTTWTAGQAFAAAAKAVKLGDNPTGQQVIAGMNTFKDETLGGLVGALTFTDGNLLGSSCAYEFNVSGGDFHTLNGGKAACVTAS